MSRPVRPRPVDINKKLPVIRSSKDLEDDEGAGTRAAQLARLTAEAEIEASNSVPGKKNINEIPTPQFIVVESYEKDYSRTFAQPSSYVRARVRTENSDFVDYDLDDEDDDWLMDFNSEKRMLSPERFESMLYKLEIMDHKARERAIASGVMVGPTAPVQIQLDSAIEFLQSQNSRQMVLQAVYSYWKNKRERWQKPILRRLQPPPPVNDTNPYNVFRPREKAHRLHTRRMQRRENNVQSFEKLRQVRRNLGQAVLLVKSLAKREEKKREIVECEVSLQRAQFKLKHETPHEDDGFTFPGIQYSQKSLSRRNEDMVGHMGNSMEMANGHLRAFSGLNQTSHIPDNIMDGADQTRRDMRRNFEQQRGRLQKRDTHEPVLLFTKRLDTEKLAAAGIVPPPDPVSPNGSAPLYRFHPRMGRGGRIVFDRWNPLEQVPLGIGRHSFPAESLQPLPPRSKCFGVTHMLLPRSKQCMNVVGFSLP